jgi:hypothetical protein
MQKDEGSPPNQIPAVNNFSSTATNLILSQKVKSYLQTGITFHYIYLTSWTNLLREGPRFENIQALRFEVRITEKLRLTVMGKT